VTSPKKEIAEPASPNLRRRLGALALTLALAIAGWSTYSRWSADRIRLTPDRVLSLVLGKTRATDGLTFGEFAKRHFAGRVCRTLDPAGFRFSMAKTGTGRHTMFRVKMIYERSLPANCQGAQTTATIADYSMNTSDVTASSTTVDADADANAWTTFVLGAKS
jgi:hypothetical protein